VIRAMPVSSAVLMPLSVIGNARNNKTTGRF